MRRDKDGSKGLFILAIIGAVFSCSFMVLQLIPIPGLEMVRFSNESYIMLAVWIVLGLAFYFKQRKKINAHVEKDEPVEEPIAENE